MGGKLCFGGPQNNPKDFLNSTFLKKVIGMANLLARIQNFTARTKWLGNFLGNRFAATTYLLKARSDRMAIGQGQFGDFKFTFRACDLSAIKEVLVDAEYAFLHPVIEEIESPVVVDVGSHIGLFSFWVLTANPQARIFGIEASPATFKILKLNVEGTQSANIKWQVINRAGWKNTETVQFSDKADSMSHKVSKNGSLQISGITLREVVEAASDNAQIDLMKVDIEGAEEAFLCAEPEALKSINRLVVELHPHLCDTDRVSRLLRETFPIVENIKGRISSKPLLYCKK